jgi:cytochrome o ubiquinol oxidase subunit 3
MSASTMTATGPAPVFYDDGSHHPQQGTLLGFWLYLMSDCLLFAVLFACYAVLGRSYAAGPSGADLFDLGLVAVNTGLLLLSSITYGFAMIGMLAGRKSLVLAWLAVTGPARAGLPGHRAVRVRPPVARRCGPQRSAFLPASSRWWVRTACT